MSRTIPTGMLPEAPQGPELPARSDLQKIQGVLSANEFRTMLAARAEDIKPGEGNPQPFSRHRGLPTRLDRAKTEKRHGLTPSSTRITRTSSSTFSL